MKGWATTAVHPLRDLWDKNPALCPWAFSVSAWSRYCKPSAAEKPAVPMIRNLGREANGYSQRSQTSKWSPRLYTVFYSIPP